PSEHEDRVVSGPFEQVVDEVEQPAVGPLEVLEREDDRPLVREPLEEQAPAREKICAVGLGPLLKAQKVRQTWLHQTALAFLWHVLLDDRAQLVSSRGGILLLLDARTRAHHLGQRPV